MPTNNYGLRMDNLNKRIREAEMKEENRDLMLEDHYLKALEVKSA